MRYPVVLRIENYTGLIKSLAIKHWKRLPPSCKSWIDEEDFFHDGVFFARYSVMPYFDFRQASFSTILTIMLSQFYTHQIRMYTRQKRTPVELPEPRSNIISDKVISHDALIRLYWDASPFLKKYLEQWFFSIDGTAGVYKTKSFKKAKREFLKLSKKFGVDFKTCDRFVARRQSLS
jgi:hypothetical protein